MKLRMLALGALAVGSVSFAAPQEVGVWRITVNNWREATYVNEIDNEFAAQRAEPGEKFIIVNLTMQNKSNKSQSFSPMIDQLHIMTGNGDVMDMDLLPMALKKAFTGGQMPPGGKRTGDVLFIVPRNASNMTFYIEFFNGSSAKWKLKK